jgi:acyl-CoA synthetase (AMP-forming)/AMP-acid ligase II
MTHFEAGLALRQIADERSTFIFPCFPTLTQSLIHHPDFAAADLSTVRGLLDTGPAESLREVERRFGVPVVTSYGLTEAGGVIAFGHLDDPLEQRSTTGGRPFRGMEARIVDRETGAELAPGETGSVLLRGVGLFDGYHKDPGRRRRRPPAAGCRPAISAASTARADLVRRPLEGHAQGRRRERLRPRGRGLPRHASGGEGGRRRRRARRAL